jgi:diphosphomevalonate decarboxylase
MSAIPDSPARAAVRTLLAGRASRSAAARAEARAPVNIALVKYWGKRNEDLNLPVTSSLSVSLGGLDTETEISPVAGPDRLELDGAVVAPDAPALRRLSAFLDLFREKPGRGFSVRSRNPVPTAAGFASSASGFAALVRALDALFTWRLDARELSILARLGSGSACRSLHEGFVEWQAGVRADGMDSHARPLPFAWPDLRVGLWTIESGAKPVSSREAMKRTVRTSPLYAAWPAVVESDLKALRAALGVRDLERFGETIEGNALAMHATLLAARPAIFYPTAGSIQAQGQVRAARADGLRIWFTMDAGPNLKLFFLEGDRTAVEARFPNLRIVPAGAAASG